MDRDFRNDMLTAINPAAAELSPLRGLTRQYSLYEVAILTRAGPARLPGLADRGHLGVGAGADIAAYTEMADKEAMLETPDYVFMDGQRVARKRTEERRGGQEYVSE